MEKSQEIIIENIKHEMRKNNLKQRDIAELLEIAESTFSNQLSGRSPLTEKSLDKLCEIFGITYEDLTGERKKIVVELNPPRNTVKFMDEKTVSPTRQHELAEVKTKQEVKKMEENKVISAMVLIMDNINDLQTTVDKKKELYRLLSDLVRDYKMNSIK